MSEPAIRSGSSNAPEQRRPIVTFFSFHVWKSKRRGGMHWLCDAYRQMGWDARFITCDYSLMTLLKGDRRTQHGQLEGVNRLTRLAPDLSVAVLLTPWHAYGRPNGVGRLLNTLTSTYPWPFRGTVARFVADADLVIVESCGALMFLDEIHKRSRAPVVYRVSDNLDTIRPVPALLAAEKHAAVIADLVSVASEHLARKFGPDAKVAIQPMGIDKTLFDLPSESPYPENGRLRVVISGSSSQDVESAVLAADACPEMDFYQFGSLARPVERPNIRYMGETEFRSLVPYVQHADIGFAPYLSRAGFEYQADHSNRLLQYVYCRLPTVVPSALCTPSRRHMFGYTPGSAESIRSAFERAAKYDRGAVPKESVVDWQELANLILASAGLPKPG